MGPLGNAEREVQLAGREEEGELGQIPEGTQMLKAHRGVDRSRGVPASKRKRTVPHKGTLLTIHSSIRGGHP